MSDFTRKAYNQYKAKWIEENDIHDKYAQHVCYKEFLDNEYQDPEKMKYYLDEETYEEYKKVN